MIDFIHIGLPKAASTWLQTVLFGQHPELAVLGSLRNSGEVATAFSQAVRRFVDSEDMSIDSGIFCQTIYDLIKSYASSLRAQGRPISRLGFSSEGLSGQWINGRNTTIVAEQLARLFPKAKIILVIREQRMMIESSYKQYIRQGGTNSLARFVLDPIVTQNNLFNESIQQNKYFVEIFKYVKIIKLYYQLFGKQNVHIECMERLRQNKTSVITDITNFLEIKPFEIKLDHETNPQLSSFTLLLLKLLNHGFHTHFHPKCSQLPVSSLIALLGGLMNSQWSQRRLANPYVTRRLISAGLQRRLVQKFLCPLDRAIVRYIPQFVGNSFRFTNIPLEQRLWMLAQYAENNAILQTMIPYDLRSLGYVMPKHENASVP